MTQNTATVVAAVLAPVCAGLLTAIATWWKSRKAKLVWYMIASQMMKVRLENGDLQHVEMGTLFLENRSRSTLTHVTVAHNGWGFNYLVQPPIEMAEIDLQSNARGFQIPRMPAKSMVTILYLFTQQTNGMILDRIYSDDGDARQLPVLLTQRRPTYQTYTLNILAFIGAWFVLYALLRFIFLLQALRHLVS